MPVDSSTSGQHHSWLLKANFHDPEREEILKRFLTEPESLEVHQLRITPLRVLSRALGKLSSRRIIDTYLRWLEVQRRSPKSNINNPWQNLVTHWTQSLRARGFKLDEVIHEVEYWKKANGPFSEDLTYAGVPLPPTLSMLKFGWNQITQGATGAAVAVAKQSYTATMGRDNYKPIQSPQHGRQIDHDRIPDKPKAERLNLTTQEDSMSTHSFIKTISHEGNSTSQSLTYARPSCHEPKADKPGIDSSDLHRPLMPVPASYVCNRCNEKGHFVNECPTNDNPDYDILPSRDYRCKFCKRPGLHYFLFCPQNPDPNSIYRRRQAKVRPGEPLCPSQGVKRSPSPSWEIFKDHKTQKLSLFLTKSYDNDRDCASPELELENRMRFSSPLHLSSPRSTSYDVQGTDGFRKEKSGSPIGSIRADTLPDGETTPSQSAGEQLIQAGILVKDFAPLKQDGVLESNEGKSRPSQLECIQSNYTAKQAQQSIRDEVVIEREKYDEQRLRAKQRRAVPETAQLLLEETMSSENRYDGFLRKLFSNHPSQSNPASRKPRPTALDMWGLNDDKKQQEGCRAVTESISDVDVSHEAKWVKLVEAKLETLDEEHRVHLKIEDENSICDYNFQDIREAPQQSEIGDSDEYIQSLIIEGKQYWTEADADMVRKQLPGAKRARSSTEGSEMESRGRKKRRDNLQRELAMIESLKEMINSKEDIESTTVEKLKSGNMSLEDLEHISGQMEESNTPTSSKHAPCSPSVSRSSSLELASYLNREGAPSPSEIEFNGEATDRNCRSTTPIPVSRKENEPLY